MTASALSIRSSKLHRVGAACAVAGVIGAAYAAAMLVIDPAVGDDRYSYPLSPGAFRVGQVFLAIQHVPLLLALVALAAAVPAGRARQGVLVAAVGMGLLSIVELLNMTAADSATDSTAATSVSTLYAIPTLVVGIGLIVGGIAAIRAGWSVPRWARWLPLALGIYMFVPLTPALAISDGAGRVALGVWMLLYVVLGFALLGSTLVADE